MSFRRFYPFGVAVITAPLASMLAIFALRARADDGEFRPIVEAEMPAGLNVGDVFFDRKDAKTQRKKALTNIGFA